MILPPGFDPLPFVSTRPLPQTVPFQRGRVSLAVTLAAAALDYPALVDADLATQLVDGVTQEASRPADVPADARAFLRADPLPSLSPAGIRVWLSVQAGPTLLASQPVLAGALLRFTAPGGLVEVVVAELVLFAGSLVRAADVGARITVGARVVSTAGSGGRG